MQTINQAEAQNKKAQFKPQQKMPAVGFSYRAIQLIIFSLAGIVACGFLWWLSATSTMKGIEVAFNMQDEPMWLWGIPVIVSCVEIGALHFIKRDLLLLCFWAAVSAIDIITTMAGAISWIMASPQLHLGGVWVLVVAFIIGVGLGFTPEPMIREVFWKYLALGLKAISK